MTGNDHLSPEFYFLMLIHGKFLFFVLLMRDISITRYYCNKTMNTGQIRQYFTDLVVIIEL